MYKPPIPGGTIGTAGALAVTGGTTAWWIALGLVMVIVGIFLLHATQRRNRLRTEITTESK